MYVHSNRDDDTAIVYDNQRHRVTHQDDFIQVLPGMAHLSPEPFGEYGAWWGIWRENREFVGRVGFGVRYLLWNPDTRIHQSFPTAFRRSAATLFRVHAFSWAGLPADIVLYILNMCPWDWFNGPEEPPGRRRSSRSVGGALLDGAGRMMTQIARGRLVADYAMEYGDEDDRDDMDDEEDDIEEDDEEDGIEEDSDEDYEDARLGFRSEGVGHFNMVLRAFLMPHVQAQFAQAAADEEDSEVDAAAPS